MVTVIGLRDVTLRRRDPYFHYCLEKGKDLEVDKEHLSFVLESGYAEEKTSKKTE